MSWSKWLLPCAFATALVGCKAEVKVQAPPPPPPPPAAPPPAPPAPPAPMTLSDRIEFDSGSPLLRADAHPTLDRIATLLSENAHVRLVELQGHSDPLGGEGDNLLLSEQRAHAVRAYLISRGVDGARLRVRGFGNKIPLASNDSPDGRAQNRRVEFRIIEQ